MIKKTKYLFSLIILTTIILKAQNTSHALAKLLILDNLLENTETSNKNISPEIKNKNIEINNLNPDISNKNIKTTNSINSDLEFVASEEPTNITKAGGTVTTAQDFLATNKIVKTANTTTGVIDSGITIDSTNNISGVNSITLPTSTANTPAIIFPGESTNTGIYSSTADTINISSQDFNLIKFGPSGVAISSGKNFTVNSPATFSDTTTFNNTTNLANTTISGTANLNGTISISGTTNLNNTTNLTGTINLDGTTNISNNLTVNGATTFNTSQTFTSDTSFTNLISPNATITTSNSNSVNASGVNMSGNINMNNNTINSVNTINATTLNASGANLNGPATFNGSTSIGASGSLTTNAAAASTFNSAATFNATGTFAGSTVFNGNANFAGLTTFNGKITLTGSASTQTISASGTLNLTSYPNNIIIPFTANTTSAIYLEKTNATYPIGTIKLIYNTSPIANPFARFAAVAYGFTTTISSNTSYAAELYPGAILPIMCTDGTNGYWAPICVNKF